MRLQLKTRVKLDYRSVFDAFDEHLFRQLAPPYPRLTVVRFDGSQPSDMVEVELRAGFKRFRWTSRIVERQVTATEAWFVDQGQQLPPPLRHWRHRHLVRRHENHTTIHDIIDYSTGSRLLDVLLYPLMLGQFAYRKPLYRRIFGKG